jgi:hypothetical protein
MTLRTGLIITGDTEGAQKALSDLTSDLNKTSGAAKDLGAAEAVAETATEALGNELRKTSSAADTVAAELERAGLTVQQLTGTVSGLSRESQQLTIAEKKLEAAAIAWAQAQERAAQATTASASEQQAAARALASAEGSLAAAKLGVVEAQQRVERAGGTNVRSMGEQALGARMLGQQFQDMGLMISMSGFTAESVLRAFSVQAGQTALAVEQMGVGGAIGKTAQFLGSPWGAVILSATMILGPFVTKLLDTKNEAAELQDNLEKAAKAADAFGNAQSLLGKVIDLNTGKFKSHNAELRETIRLQAEAMLLKGQQDEKAARDRIGGLGKPGLLTTIGGYLADNPGASYGGGSGSTRQQAAISQETAPLRALRDEVLTGKMDATAIRQRVDSMAQAGKLAGYTTEQIIALKQELFTLPQALNDQAAARMARDAVDGKGVADPLKPYKTTKPKKPKSTASLDEFGRDTADRIASITEAFSQTPPAVQQADKAVRQLDDLIDDLSRKKPPNFEALIVSAKDAKQTVETGLLRSIEEAFAAPETLADKAAKAIGALDGILGKKKGMLSAGLIDQADFDAFGKRLDEAKGKIEAGLVRPYNDFIIGQQQSLAILQLQARGQTDQAEALRTVYSLEKNLRPLREDQKEAILASVQALRAEQREVDVLRQKTQIYVDAVSSVEGAVREATQAWVRGDLGQFIKTPGKLLDAFATLKGQKLFEDLFGDMFRDLKDQANGTSVIKDASARMAASVDQVTASTGRTTQALDSLARSASSAAGAVSSSAGGAGTVQIGTKIGDAIAANLNPEIVVTGKRKEAMTPDSLIAKATGGIATSIASIFTNKETAKNIGGSIGKFAGENIGKGLSGAATGSMVAGLGNALGIKMSGTGAQIGGAIGSFIPIPGGDIIGSVLGGLVGNLFKSTPRGSAQITSVDQKANVSGNSAEVKTDLGNLAGSVQGALSKIASTLGADVGSFAVSINKYKDSYRVDPSGGTSVGGKYGDRDGVLKFDNNDADGAVRAAIANAISDGAIKGLSGAVQKALGSSSDIDKAMQEALKVSNVEDLLGGVSGQLTKSFKAFEKEAADRLRIAREYGFDIVQVEAANAKERVALTDKLMDQQVGSLKRLVDELTSGSMFEGSAVDRRTALLDSITKAQADVQAGVDGAGDKLASLYEQLNSVSKEVYGTTGGFAVDRAAIVDQARAAIAKVNADVSAAQQRASDPALTATNAALDENNDQNAKVIAQNEQILATLKKAVDLLGKSVSDSDVARLLQLARTS